MQNNVDITAKLIINYPIVDEILWSEQDLSPFEAYRIRATPLDDTSVLPLGVRNSDGSQEVWLRGSVEQMIVLRDTIDQLLNQQ